MLFFDTDINYIWQDFFTLSTFCCVNFLFFSKKLIKNKKYTQQKVLRVKYLAICAFTF